jgi:hypothetical protein
LRAPPRPPVSARVAPRPTPLDGLPPDRWCFVPVSLVGVKRPGGRGRNLRRLPIGYAAVASPEGPPHPALIAMAREPLGLRCPRFSRGFARTHSGILTSPRSTPGLHRGFTARRTLPYPSASASRDRRPRFGGPLNPDHSRRMCAGLVSYYALFQGMAASKPTSQLSRHAHILRYTQRPLRGLSGGSGFFPSRRWTLSLSDCLPGSLHNGIRSSVGVGTWVPRPRPSGRSTSAGEHDAGSRRAVP